MTTYVLRHGESSANVEGVIVSAPEQRALTEVGLTDLGRDQAAEAGETARALGLGPATRILSSDFARARETAMVLAASLGAAAPRWEPRLRERGFGEHEEGPVSAYELVWAADATHRDPGQGVEPVASVAARVAEVLAEQEDPEADVVLVAHGDVLQIALALGAGVDPHDHRGQPHLANAELRALGPHRPHC